MGTLTEIVEKMPYYSYLYQTRDGVLNAVRYAKYPGLGWCDLWNEIEDLGDDYIAWRLSLGDVRTYKLDPVDDCELIALYDMVDTREAVRP